MTIKNLIQLNVIFLIFIPLLYSSSEVTKTTSYKDNSEHQKGKLRLSVLKDDLIKNNPVLKSIESERQALLEKAQEVSTMPDPMFSYTYFPEPVETRLGAQRQKLMISQKFPWFGKLSLKEESVRYAAKALRYRHEAQKLNLLNRLEKKFYEYYFLARRLELLDEELKLMRYVESVARSRYESGKMKFSGLIKLQLEIEKMDVRRKNLADQAPALSAAINALTGKSSETLLPFPDKENPDKKNVSSSMDELSGLLRNHPSISEIEVKEKMFKTEADASSRRRFPDFTLGLSWTDIERYSFLDLEENGRDSLGITVSFNLPIKWSAYSAAVSNSRLQAAATESLMRNRLLSLERDLKMALSKISEAQRKMSLYSDSLIPRAEQLMKVSVEEFSAGQITTLELIDSQRLLLELRLETEKAFVDMKKAAADLNELTGGTTPRENREED